MVKLTEAQRVLLEEISFTPRAIAPYYAPAKKLVSLNLAKLVAGRLSDTLEITDAGRSALESE